MWGAEEIWYKRLCGESLVYFPEPSNDFLEFTKQFSARSQSYIDLVNSKDEKYFFQPCSYKAIVGTSFTNMPWQIIMHCMNHSTYHRGQIVTILREVGVTTIPSTDMIVYFRETQKA